MLLIFNCRFVRNSLLQIAKVNPDDFTAIPYGGTGSLVIESTLKTMLGFQRSVCCYTVVVHE